MMNETYRRAVVLTVKFGIEIDTALCAVRDSRKTREQARYQQDREMTNRLRIIGRKAYEVDDDNPS